MAQVTLAWLVGSVSRVTFRTSFLLPGLRRSCALEDLSFHEHDWVRRKRSVLSNLDIRHAACEFSDMAANARPCPRHAAAAFRPPCPIHLYWVFRSQRAVATEGNMGEEGPLDLLAGMRHTTAERGRLVSHETSGSQLPPG